MSTPTAERIQNQTLDLVTQGQKAALDVLGAISESWADATRRVSGGVPGPAPAVPAGLFVLPPEAVDRFFDTGVQILEAQRALVHGMVSAFSPSGSSTTR